MDKREFLVKLRKQMLEDNNLPLRKEASNLVFGEGDASAGIFFLGEAPGFWEDKKARPFVGNAGKLLDAMLLKIRLTRHQIFITNLVHFRPPENRDPTEGEIEAFRPYVDKMIEIIKPNFLITLGRHAMAKFLPEAKISVVHGESKKLRWNKRDMLIIPMYHPAAALRQENIRLEFEKDFSKLKEIIEKT